MSDWSYYDKRDVIDNTKKAAAGVDSHQKEIRALRDEVKSLRAAQREFQESNRRLTEAFTQLAREMQKMREDMYPTSKTTKKGLQAPGTSAAKTPAAKPAVSRLRNPH